MTDIPELSEKEMQAQLERLLGSEEAWEQADEAFRIHMLVQGAAWDGSLYWAYMAVPPSKILPFRIALSQGNNAILDYGDLLSFGYGKEPPDDVKKEMEEKYNLSHSFEEDVVKKVAELQKSGRLKKKYSSKLHKKHPRSRPSHKSNKQTDDKPE